MSVAVIPPSKLSIVNTKQKYFLDLEEIIKNSRYSPEINFIDAFYWGYLTCTYDKEAPAKLLEKIGTIVTCESEKIITTNDKYNLYVQQLQDPTINVDAYIVKKLENPSVLPNLVRNFSEEEKLSEAMILKLKAEEELEKEKNRKRLDELNNNVNCPICFETLTSKQFLGFDRCGHSFHADCVRPYIKESIDARKLPIRCPHDRCRNEILENDLVDILDKTYLEKFNEYSLAVYLDRNAGMHTWCPTPNCKFAFEADSNVPEFFCQLCKKHYCLRCRVEYHKGMTCKEYQISNDLGENDKLFQNLVQGAKFKQCPSCKFWVERISGCQHMTCRCGYEFCYICGGHYGDCECDDYLSEPDIDPEPIDEVWDDRE